MYLKQSVNEGDTTIYSYISYRDARYEVLVEYGSIFFFSKEAALEFADMLVKAAEAPSDATTTFNVQGARIIRFSGGGWNIGLYDKDGATFYMSSAKALDLSDAIKSFSNSLK